MWAPGITRIEFVADMGESPACVHRSTGVIFLNRRIWKELETKFPDLHRDIKFFILLHEWAHVTLQSRDEKLVDKFAHKVYLSYGKSLKASNYALTYLLDARKRGHAERMLNQFNRAWEFDRFANRNPKIKTSSPFKLN